jgi:hypothetical protein
MSGVASLNQVKKYHMGQNIAYLVGESRVREWVTGYALHLYVWPYMVLIKLDLTIEQFYTPVVKKRVVLKNYV